jgi:hypothetical protein
MPNELRSSKFVTPSCTDQVGYGVLQAWDKIGEDRIGWGRIG